MVRILPVAAQGRVGDKGNVQACAHGCPACPHPAIGPAIIGSPDVLTNGLPSLRVDDFGMHAVCCNTNFWTATKGAQTVFINGKAAHRMNDAQKHCGGQGKLVEGSPNVMVEDGTGGGGGGGGAAGGAAGGKAGGGGGGTNGGGSKAGGAGGSGGGTAGKGGNGAGAGSGAQNGGAQNGGAGSAGDGVNDEPDTPIEPDQLEVSVVSAAGETAGGVRFELTMPDGSVINGTTDVNGVIKVTGLTQRGDCVLRFPSIDDAHSEQP